MKEEEHSENENKLQDSMQISSNEDEDNGANRDPNGMQGSR